MTVTTTIIALLPVMIGNVFDSGSQVMQRIAAPMVGGLVSATVLTLLIIPAIYMIWKGSSLKREIRRAGRERLAASA
jgi:Cu(I)/Ag(I) efflux system membrane protein CusA/SilA